MTDDLLSFAGVLAVLAVAWAVGFFVGGTAAASSIVEACVKIERFVARGAAFDCVVRK